MAKLLDIDPEQVIKLAERQWSNREIAAFMDCDEGTIRNRFSAELAKGRDCGKAKLRDLQWKAAIAGNTTMLIWLGKQYLDQSDKNESMLKSDGSFKIVIEKGSPNADGNHLPIARFSVPSLS